MKILTLYSTSVNTTYKNSICSCAALFVFVSTVFIVVAPIYLIVYISNDLWHQPKIFYEKPSVSFQYKYILLGEHSPLSGESLSVDNSEFASAEDSSSSLAVMSSFGYFNEMTESWQKRGTVKFWKEDFDHNNIADRLHFQFTYASLPSEPLTYLHMFLELDAHITNHHCRLHIPSAVILAKEQLPPNFQSGQISYEGKLKLEQKSSFYCPYFMRNVKSNFYFELIPSNSTNVKDYGMTSIREKLSRNVGFIKFEKTGAMWDRSSEDKITINLCVDIGEIRTRFHATFWQKLMLFWTEYLAVLVVFVFCFNKLKLYLFSRQVFRAWEIIPWKKIY